MGLGAGGTEHGTWMMREAFQAVSPCRTTTTSVNSPASLSLSLSATDADDIPTAAPGWCPSFRRICRATAAAGPAGARDAEAPGGGGSSEVRTAAMAARGGGGRHVGMPRRSGGGGGGGERPAC
ncbi:Os08g0476500 [Oryza sativa Japonica Group]|jgi:hypothetical protein|uniref:Os08g0476500 protein n=1 Tax=Oryza sativa subsp. japonica TaxID=39947 RepID=A0A0P0XGT3_ORYSJ|nr:Os08g0476500 [Oryza sativa Japonica Group]